MERFTISKSEKQTIYEIYRACRLCGAGGGYRMPIIQNIVDFDGSNIELRQKIQECLQLEVRQDDRMPPLICELCVDKVNEFYEFFEMSRQTNIRTRTRLGLPLQTAKKGEPEPGDCILGVTEPVCVNDPPKKSKAGPKCSKKVKKEEDTVKEEDNVPPPPPAPESRSSSVSSRSSRAGQRVSSPPRPARTQHKHTRTDTPRHKQVAPEKRNEKENVPKPRLSMRELSELMQDANLDDNSLLVPRSLKRGREAEPPKPLILPKRTKISPKEPAKEPVKEPIKEPTPPPRPRHKPGPKPKQAPKPEPPKPEPPKPEPVKIPVPLKIPRTKAKIPATPPKEEVPPPPKTFDCDICNMQLKTVQALARHKTSHVPTYTKLQHACNPCGKWFVSGEEATAHHRSHRSVTNPYHCRRCADDFRSLQLYNEHLSLGRCAPPDELPDVSCDRCWRPFPTRNLLAAHKCPGVDGRPGGKCSKCSKSYATHKTLKKHESTCNQRRKRDLIADPDVLRRLKPMQVRISRCDDLLSRASGPQYDVSKLKPNYGLDKLYHYPYFNFETVKSKPTNKTTAADELERDSFIHWDSEDSDSDSVVKKVDSLSTLAIKKLFSSTMLGKVPRKRKRVKNEAFDLGNEFGNDFGNISNDINDIISSFSDDSVTDCVVRNMNEQLRISLNHIIGVPDDSDSIKDLGNEHVVSNQNVDVNDSTERGSENVFNDKRDNSNENVELTNEHSNDALDENGKMNDTLNNDNNLNTQDAQEDQNTIIEKANVESFNDNNFNTRDDQNTIIEEAKVESCNENNMNTQDAQDDQNTTIEEANVESSNDNNLKTQDVQNTIIEEAKVESCNDNKMNTLDAQDDQNTTIEEANVESSDDNNLNTQDVQNTIIEEAKVESCNDNNMNTQDAQDSNDNNLNTQVVQNSIIEEANVETCNDNNLNTQEAQDDQKTTIEEANVEHSNDNNFNTQDAQDDRNIIIEEAKVNEKICDDAITEIETNSSNKLDIETESNDGNEELNRIENEKGDSSQHSEDTTKEVTLHNSIETHREVVAFALEQQNPTVNGNNDHEHEIDSKYEDDPETNHDYNDSESKKSEEINKLVHKESPIKHSIENLIGDTDRNPEKYINEVISSIEDIIMKNPRTGDDHKSNEREKGETKSVMDDNDIDDQNLMDALDAQIGDTKDIIDNDKITLEDLLPKEDRAMDLDDISDEDFNFDA